MMTAALGRDAGGVGDAGRRGSVRGGCAVVAAGVVAPAVDLLDEDVDVAAVGAQRRPQAHRHPGLVHRHPWTTEEAWPQMIRTCLWNCVTFRMRVNVPMESSTVRSSLRGEIFPNTLSEWGFVYRAPVQFFFVADIMPPTRRRGPTTAHHRDQCKLVWGGRRFLLER